MKRDNTLNRTKNIRKAGFTLIEIMIVVTIIGTLAAIVIPNFIKARATSQADACINNLRQVSSAANQWALEHNKSDSDTINYPADLAPYIKLTSSGKIPGCPAGGTYACATVGASPTCSLGTLTPAHQLQ
jgi:prepilin-type N-terminal cleavage/methylation domain-containing protein